MKLHYLYVDGFKLFQKCEMRFSDDYDIVFDGKKDLSIGVRESCVPKGFFSLRKSEANPVESVSAIVGKNGSGKTSIASFLYNVKRKTLPNDSSFVLVYSVGHGNRLVCLYKLVEEIVLAGDFAVSFHRYEKGKGELVCTPELAGSGDDFSLAYYSPTFVPYSPCPSSDSKYGINDLSTTGFLKQAVSQYNALVPFPEKVAYRNYELQDMERIIRFAFAYNRLPANRRNMTLPVARRVEVSLDSDSHESALQKLKEIADCSRIERLTTLNQRHGFFVSAFQCFARIAFLLLEKDAGTCGKMTSESLVQVLETVVAGLKPKHNGKERQRKARKAILAYIKKASRGTKDHAYVRDAYAFFKRLALLLNERCVNDLSYSIEAPFRRKKGGAEKPFTELLGLVNLQHRSLGRPFVCFRLRPDMSSGELSYYSLFGRLHESLVSGLVGLIAHDDVLAFLDEAETSLHPEWQRQLVCNVIWFFEQFAPKRRVQVLFASHSPLLLSDIPIGNVVFLHKDRGTERMNVARVTNEFFQNTFAANVYDLFRLPFFMEEGVIGAFACKRLNEILDRKNGTKDAKLPPEELQIASMIGDRALRDYLLSDVMRT